MISLVVFVCQGGLLGLEARQVAGMGQLQSSARVVDGERVDLSAVLPGLAAQEPVEKLFFLQLRHGPVLLLERRAWLVEMDAGHIWPLPGLLELGKRHSCIKALAWHNEQPVLLLDAKQLPLQSA